MRMYNDLKIISTHIIGMLCVILHIESDCEKKSIIEEFAPEYDEDIFIFQKEREGERDGAIPSHLLSAL